MKATWASSPVLEGRTLEMDWRDGDSDVLSLSPLLVTTHHHHHPHPHHRHSLSRKSQHSNYLAVFQRAR